MQVLFLGSGDLRNVLHTAANLSDITETFEVHFNDWSSEVVARNVLLLDIIATADPGNAGDVRFVWDVWYNFSLSEASHQRLTTALQTLLSKDEASLPAKVADPEELELLRSVWRYWLSISTSPSASAILEETAAKRLVLCLLYAGRSSASAIQYAQDGVLVLLRCSILFCYCLLLSTRSGASHLV